MINEFLKDIKVIYKEIENISIEDIRSFRLKWNIEGSIGEAYEAIVKKHDRKSSGRFYTPYDVADYINSKMISSIVLEKTNTKILDPSCGGGYFLIDMFKKLDNLLDGKIDNHKKYIIDNMLYGYDIDKIAIYITVIELYYLSGYVSRNIKNKDYLSTSNRVKFNMIIGNPPYIGHKVLNKDYSRILKDKYPEVFYNKGDISFCFIKKSLDILDEDGRLGFFTSRYLIESLYGEGVRNYIINNSYINRIIDFYGVRILKNVGVDNIIMLLSKKAYSNNIEYFRLKDLAKDMGAKVFSDIETGMNILTTKMEINPDDIKDKPWSFQGDTEKTIISKINNKCSLRIEEIGYTFQGIITGNDKAFIVEYNSKLSLEESVLKPWLKGKQVNRFFTDKPLKKIIYTDIIEDIDSYQGVKEYLMPHKDKLESRRECIRGIRKWYNIQWGRKSCDFEGIKIIFPYKAHNNRFSIDKGNYFSADIYGLKITNNEYSYEFLTGLLNSSIYEFYIKTIAKKLGDRLYEYYPNKIIKLPIPPFIKEIEILYNGRKTDINSIDRILIEFFNISEEEFRFISKYLS
ncbi:MAG: N-6 DNA methylase [Clostridium sp.]